MPTCSPSIVQKEIWKDDQHCLIQETRRHWTVSALKASFLLLLLYVDRSASVSLCPLTWKLFPRLFSMCLAGKRPRLVPLNTVHRQLSLSNDDNLREPASAEEHSDRETLADNARGEWDHIITSCWKWIRERELVALGRRCWWLIWPDSEEHEKHNETRIRQLPVTMCGTLCFHICCAS